MQPLSLRARDGTRLGGLVWAHATPVADRSVVVVHSATSVRCRYYTRFAQHLHAAGHDVIVYDYRGIGDSRPARLRGMDASWLDWGMLDAEAALQHALAAFPGRPLDAVGHSFGGCAAGLAPSAHRVRRLVTVGAQYAYWRDYAPGARWRMVLQWHVAMPLLARLLGHVPARRLGWMEDTPRGVALDWASPRARLEDRPSGRRAGLAGPPPSFAAVRADLLAVTTTDDPFGTVAATDRLLGYYTGCRRTHLRVAPADIGATAIGHFGFFHSRFEATLWPLAAAWLAEGRLPAPAPGTVIPARPAL